MVGSELHHPNVNPFIGCIVEKNFTAIMTKYCSRRSLKIVLTNSELTFDCLFKLSFISDAAMGLHYLHGKKIIHKRLHLNNCLVDEQWTLMLSGTVVVLHHNTLSTIHYPQYTYILQIIVSRCSTMEKLINKLTVIHQR